MFRGSISIVVGQAGILRKSFQASPVLIQAAQNHRVASTEAKPKLISKNLSFRSAYDSEIEQNERPLVLLYSWLVAKATHIHKYSDFYMKKGYDVLHVKIDPLQLLRPTKAKSVVGQVVDFTQQSERQNQPILVHGFSVGGYLYGETLVNALSNPATKTNLENRIRGQILDSPVNFEGIPFGVSRAVTNNVLLQNLIQGMISSYLTLTKKYTMTHYIRSQRTFEENYFQAPTMFLYSLADVIGPPGPIIEVMAGMKERGLQVYEKCFEKSRHVCHFQAYPVEYIGMLTYFLQEIGILSEPIAETMQMRI